MREKDQMLHFRVSKAELEIIRRKMQEVSVRNMGWRSEENCFTHAVCQQQPESVCEKGKRDRQHLSGGYTRPADSLRSDMGRA